LLKGVQFLVAQYTTYNTFASKSSVMINKDYDEEEEEDDLFVAEFYSNQSEASIYFKENFSWITGRFLRKSLFASVIDHVVRYPSPVNLNYNWGFGSLSLFYLIVQLISGILFTIYYTPSIADAFESVQFIMREVNYGWLIRYAHTTGSSVFFAVVYLHIGRGLYYGSYYYPRILLWYSGLIIFFLMMATAFFGYILPWGQMSYWAATVITNLFATIPYIGEQFTLWLWGDYAVGNATLKRFFTFHFILPFIILGLVLVHIVLLHRVGSNNPIGKDHNNFLPLYPYFFIKDLYLVFFSLIIFVILMTWYPNLFIHPDNNVPANPLVTPEHIVPEWYFLPFYAILRTIPSKFLGFVCMIFSILIMFFIPFLSSLECHRSTLYQLYQRYFFFLLIGDFLVLGWLGGCSIEYPFLDLSRICTFYYFFFFLIVVPVSGLITYLQNISSVELLQPIDDLLKRMSFYTTRFLHPMFWLLYKQMWQHICDPDISILYYWIYYEYKTGELDIVDDLISEISIEEIFIVSRQRWGIIGRTDDYFTIDLCEYERKEFEYLLYTI